MRRVLILEREAFLGTLLSERFRRSGFSVRLLADVVSGTWDDLEPPDLPDLIVVGAAEPGVLTQLGGWAAVTPTIVLGDAQGELPAWPFPTLDKPFSPNQLVDLASRYLLAQKLHEHELKGAAPG